MSKHPSNNNPKPGDSSSREEQRLDKWLWAARFFKTRNIASEAISGGKIQVDNQRTKPARSVRPGTRVRIRRGPMEWEVIVQGISKQRRPASEAVLLYQETPESIANREKSSEQRKMEKIETVRGEGRPTKRDRRKLSELTGR